MLGYPLGNLLTKMINARSAEMQSQMALELEYPVVLSVRLWFFVKSGFTCKL